MSTRDITIEDLAKVKGLGATKAEKVLQVIGDAEGAFSASDLSTIPGVSERIAKQVVKLTKDPDNYTPEPPTPRQPKPVDEYEVNPTTKRITKKATAKKATRATNGNGNGSHSRSPNIKAGDVRRFAQDAEKLGLESLAETLRIKVAAKLDNQTVPADSLR